MHEKGDAKVQANFEKKIFYYKEITLEIFEKTYYPREDSLLLLKFLEGLELPQKEILDMGTGSGLQAIFCAKKRVGVDAVDISTKALENAKLNAKKNNALVNFFISDLFKNISKKYDLILFNAPYLPTKRDLKDSEEKTWSSGPKNQIIRKFLQDIKNHLKENGTGYLVISSITNLDLKEIETEYSLRLKAVRSQKIPWEELYLIEIK